VVRLRATPARRADSFRDALGERAAGARRGGAVSPAGASTRAAAARAWALVGLAAAAGAGLFAALDLAPASLPSCAFRQATGLPCLTCGATRAFVRLAHGDVAASWAAHPLAVLVAAQLLLAWALAGLALALGRVPRAGRWVAALARADAWALIAIWLARLVTGARPL
jgi:hypothetical protein